MNLPDFIIIGETKTGSTSVYNYLLEHPQIKGAIDERSIIQEVKELSDSQLSNSKEIRYYDRYYFKGLDWYKSKFPATDSDEITGEATPMYFFRTLTASRLAKDVPKVKLIVLLRNPVDRLYSNFQHNNKYITNWSKKYSSFEEYLNTCSDSDYYLIEKGLYVYTIQKWLKFFPKNQLMIITTEEMRDSPQNGYSKILRFLGVQDYIIERFSLHRTNSYKPMKKETRHLLEDFYMPFNEELEKLLGVKLNW